MHTWGMMMRRYIGVICFSALVGLFSMPTAPLAQQKTVKQCDEEYKANKAEIQKSGRLKKDFMAECRGASTVAPAEVPGAPAKPAAATPVLPPPGAKPAPAAPAATGKPSSATLFATEAEAKSHCPSDTVVWANLKTSIYHFSGTHNYGNTKSGAYMCEKDTAAAGIRPAKNEMHP
jgi:hypothetical protein